MAATLTWQGPIGPGAFPDDPLLFETLCTAGVYLRIKRYDGGRVVAYAGQSVSLLARFDQHLAAMLSLAAPLRDASGSVVFAGDAGARLEAYADLGTMAALAAADAGRVRFFYALCDDYFHQEHLNLAEGLLQRRIASRLSPGLLAVENAVAAPARMPDDCPDVWENDCSGLDEPGRAVVKGLLGEMPMRLEEASGGVV